jgi:hypothetical protein
MNSGNVYYILNSKINNNLIKIIQKYLSIIPNKNNLYTELLFKSHINGHSI